ncbi:hypothetical protein KP509_39G006800 [Ceratopteris richardii]|uniref:Uncharacterized protein n=1 Tax=Ceratopteris richardii TaxID=49495 RepID=A0A8T2PYT6_CERRI|nr:hypothetical protein KP509_39G006800 [Ceratopteris richardii]
MDLFPALFTIFLAKISVDSGYTTMTLSLFLSLSSDCSAPVPATAVKLSLCANISVCRYPFLPPLSLSTFHQIPPIGLCARLSRLSLFLCHHHRYYIRLFVCPRIS